MQRIVGLAAPLATLLFAAAVAGFGAMFEVYSHLRHPVSMLGASGVPRAGAFNALGFVLPGLMAAFAALALRSRLGAGAWSARIGAQALLLSALAFAAQGLLPLDSADLHAAASRLHAAAWTAWWIAFAVGAALLAWGLRGRDEAGVAKALAGCAAATLAFALLAPGLLPAGLSQRLAFAGWFAALWVAGGVSRSAA